MHPPVSNQTIQFVKLVDMLLKSWMKHFDIGQNLADNFDGGENDSPHISHAAFPTGIFTHERLFLSQAFGLIFSSRLM